MVTRSNNPMLLTAIALIGVGAAESAADTIHVPDDAPTIQQAIDMAFDGDVILVARGVYRETIDCLGKAIEIRSEAGARATVIDGAQQGTVITCVSGEDAETIIDGFTITGGSGTPDQFGETEGGGMLIFDAGPTILNCVFTLNAVQQGGGAIRAVLGTLSIDHCDFVANHADEIGGAIEADGSSIQIISTTFRENTSFGSGGAVFGVQTQFEVSDCSFIKNEATVWAGGLTFAGGGGSVVDSVFDQNTSERGAIGGELSPLIVDNCIFTNNTATNSGGGISFSIAFDGTKVSITGCLFDGNTAATDGGAIHGANGFGITIDDCAFENNIAGLDGGAIRTGLADVAIGNSSFCDNERDDINGDYADAGGNTFCSPADLNGDGMVGTTDLIILLGVWGPCDDCHDCLGDIDQDCTVGTVDLILLLGDWG